VAESAREKLLEWLERRASNPVLRADPKDYPQSKRDKLKQVQEKPKPWLNVSGATARHRRSWSISSEIWTRSRRGEFIATWRI